MRIRRAGRSGAGGAVGVRAHHDQRGTGAALQTGRLRRIAAGCARTGQPARHTEPIPRGTGARVRQGKLLASRLLPWARSGHLTVPRSGDYVLAPTERGAIDNLRLTEAEVPPPDEGYVQVRVEAAGLNFRDVLNVLGLYPGDPGPIGGDFAGIVTQLGDGVTGLEVGQRVYGFMQGAFSSRFNVPVQLLAPMPDGVSAVEAATIPAAALTVRLAVRLGAAQARRPRARPRRQRWRRAGGDPDGTAVRRHGLRHGQHLQARDAAQARCEVRLRLAHNGFRRSDPGRHRWRGRRRGAQQPDQRGVPRRDSAGDRPERPLRRDRQARHLDTGADGCGPSRYRLRDRRAGHRHHPASPSASAAC